MSPGEVTLTCRISLTHSLGSPSHTLFLCRDKPQSHTPYYLGTDLSAAYQRCPNIYRITVHLVVREADQSTWAHN